MNTEQYKIVEKYMVKCMADSAHDRKHVYRVLHTALLIAREETQVDWDVLICASLLHDIGRAEQFANPTLCHARVGGEKAYRFLTEHGFSAAFAEQVRHCITAHRYRASCPPESLEAKILFDADKLDAAGAMGVARTLLYQGHQGTPLYSLTEEGNISDGTGDVEDSFFREYKFKLENLYDRFYTKQGRALAQQRRQTAVDFYQALLQEAEEPRKLGNAILEALLHR